MDQRKVQRVPIRELLLSLALSGKKYDHIGNNNRTNIKNSTNNAAPTPRIIYPVLMESLLLNPFVINGDTSIMTVKQ